MNTSLHRSVTALAALFAGSTAFAQFSFQSTNYAVGPSPDAAAIGDFNGDTFPDLAVANDNPDKVSILLNAGNGAFGAPVSVLLGNGTSPNTPVAGDLDGDGDLDLAVSLKNVNSVRILVNNGGTFTLGPVFTVGAEPRDMKIGDLDNDGDLDLVVSNRSGDTVSVLRNGGSLAFTVASFAAGLEPREIEIGELTGDNLPDIAIAAHDSRQVIVLRNVGAASFVNHANLPTNGEKPEGLALARLDPNASLDIAATISINNQEFAILFMNNGSGAFTGAGSFFLNGVDSSAMVNADLDVDGDQDLATANQGSNNVSVIGNTGTGSFGGPQVFAVGTAPGHIAAGDLDHDGVADLVATNELSGNVTVLLNNAAGNDCSVTPYCVGSVNSGGTVAAISATGTPNAAGNFVIHIASGLPHKSGVLFYGTNGPATIPFQGGTLCAQPPIIRLAAQQMSATGTANFPLTVTPPMVGTARWFQFLYRDPANPGGTGAALSNALEVHFCN